MAFKLGHWLFSLPLDLTETLPLPAFPAYWPSDYNYTIGSSASQAFRLRLKINHQLSWLSSNLLGFTLQILQLVCLGNCTPIPYNKSINSVFLVLLLLFLCRMLTNIWPAAKYSHTLWPIPDAPFSVSGFPRKAVSKQSSRGWGLVV